MTDNGNLVYMHDPEHAWLRVPLALVADEIGSTYSNFSYYNSRYAYLEEDRDMTLFLENHVEVDTEQIDTQYFETRQDFLAEVRKW